MATAAISCPGIPGMIVASPSPLSHFSEVIALNSFYKPFLSFTTRAKPRQQSKKCSALFPDRLHTSRSACGSQVKSIDDYTRP